MGSLPDVIIEKKQKNGLSNNIKVMNQGDLKHTKSATNLWQPLKPWNSSKPVQHTLPKRPQTQHQHHLTIKRLDNGELHIPVHLRDPDTLYEQTIQRTFDHLERPVHIPLRQKPIQKTFHAHRKQFNETVQKNCLRWADENENHDVQFINKAQLKIKERHFKRRMQEKKVAKKWKHFQPQVRLSTINYQEKQRQRRTTHKRPEKMVDEVKDETPSNAELMDAIYNEWAQKQ